MSRNLCIAAGKAMAGFRKQPRRPSLQRGLVQKEENESRGGVVWGDLPPVLQGRVFRFLTDKERCHVIPLVSREWNSIHKTYPPQHIKWAVSRRVSRPLLLFFDSIASSLKSLRINIVACNADQSKGPGLVLQMLTIAAVRAPRLRTLVIDDSDDKTGKAAATLPLYELLDSLAMFSQLEQLTMYGFVLPEIGSTMQFQGLAGLRSLKEVVLWDVRNNGRDSRLSAAFWQALASLKCLTKLHFLFEDDQRQTEVFQQLSLLKNLRKLEADPGVLDTVEENMMLPESFGTLKQLNQLKLSNLPTSGLRPIMGLPELEHLSIVVTDDESGEGAALLLESTCLTKLEIEGFYISKPSVAAFLPIDAHYWSSIRELTLKDMEFNEIPEGLASALVSVSFLNLTDNQFARLPTTVKLLSNLQYLDISENAPLQLEEEDEINTLAALPCLKILNIRKSCENRNSSGWSGSSVVAFIAISRRFPLLKMALKY